MISGFASGDPLRLQALPARCTLADVKAVLGKPLAKGRGMLGERELDVHFFSVPELKKHVHAWIDMSKVVIIKSTAENETEWIDPDDEGEVVLLDVESPPAPESLYLRVLGLPDERLDYQWAGSVMSQTQSVWLSRGAAIVSGPHVRGVVRAGIFTPTTLDDFNANVRFDAAEIIQSKEP